MKMAAAAKSWNTIYEDSVVAIDDHEVVLKGFLVPWLSTVKIDFAEIEEVEAVKLHPLARFNLLGTQNFETWWVFDPMRPVRKQGFIMKVIGGRFHIGFTASDFDAVFAILTEKLGPRFHDRRNR
jgi:hypothetical protein